MREHYGFTNIKEWLTYSIMQMNSKIFHNWSARRDIMIYNSNNWALKSNWTNIFRNMQTWNNCESNVNHDTNPNHLLPLLLIPSYGFSSFFSCYVVQLLKLWFAFNSTLSFRKKMIIHVKKEKYQFLRLCKSWSVYRKVLKWNKLLF